MTLDETKLQQFMEKVLNDLAAAASAPMGLIGDQLGLYKTLAKSGPLTVAELAERSECMERYIREWLGNQAAGGYLEYDSATEKYFLPAEHAAALADEDSPYFIGGAWQCLAAAFAAQPRIQENFKTGNGMEWSEHDARLFIGTERFFRPHYLGHLLQEWIPSIEGLEAKLKNGAKVADVGCGLGTSTLLMAKHFPNSRFLGFDYHAPSVHRAQKRAQEAGLADRVHFEVAESTEYPGDEYDLVAHFDCLHDMGDPVGAARHVQKTLAKDGVWMIVEPKAGDRVEENLNPVGRMCYAISTHICVPVSLAQDGPALGAQAGQARLERVAAEAGFTRFRRAAETSFNMILEARK